MKSFSRSTTSRASGFTLVELLVVVAIIIVLAMVAFVATRSVMQKAASANSLSRLRQSGTILVSHAFENNGKFQYATNPDPAESPYLPYNIVRRALNLRIAGEDSPQGDLCEIMHWDASKLKPEVYHQDCFGVNFTDVTTSPDGLVAEWTTEDVDDGNGQIQQVRTLVANKVTRPDLYPILLDSSTAQGNEIFRIVESTNHLVAMRDGKRAHAYLLDSSARALTGPELKKSGFSKFYDTTSKTAKMTNL